MHASKLSRFYVANIHHHHHHHEPAEQHFCPLSHVNAAFAQNNFSLFTKHEHGVCVYKPHKNASASNISTHTDNHSLTDTEAYKQNGHETKQPRSSSSSSLVLAMLCYARYVRIAYSSHDVVSFRTCHTLRLIFASQQVRKTSFAFSCARL